MCSGINARSLHANPCTELAVSASACEASWTTTKKRHAQISVKTTFCNLWMEFQKARVHALIFIPIVYKMGTKGVNSVVNLRVISHKSSFPTRRLFVYCTRSKQHILQQLIDGACAYDLSRAMTNCAHAHYVCLVVVFPSISCKCPHYLHWFWHYLWLHKLETPQKVGLKSAV